MHPRTSGLLPIQSSTVPEFLRTNGRIKNYFMWQRARRTYTSKKVTASLQKRNKAIFHFISVKKIIISKLKLRSSM